MSETSMIDESKCTCIRDRVYDVARLLEEAERFDGKYHFQPGGGRPWQGLPLRNPTASIQRDGIAIGHSLIGAGQGMKPCLDTAYLEDMPYISEILADFASRSEVFLVRLLKLLPKHNVKPHCDGTVFHRKDGRIARFHIPIRTDPSIKMIWTEGSTRCPTKREEVHLREGELYYTDVSGRHWVENPTEDVERVHLVIDVELNDAVRELLEQNSALPLNLDSP